MTAVHDMWYFFWFQISLDLINIFAFSLLFLFSFPIGCLVVSYSVSFVSSPSSVPFHPKLVTADSCPCSKGVFPPHFHPVLAHHDRLIVGYNIKHLEATVDLMLYKYNHTHSSWTACFTTQNVSSYFCSTTFPDHLLTALVASLFCRLLQIIFYIKLPSSI